MAVKPQAMAQMINKKITAGPPEKQAEPILLKLPAPMMAAIPKKVKSLTVNTRCNPESWLSASVIAVTGFLRNKLLKIKPIKNKLML
jgi:hypothetical protein